jgi:hypothetical protein
MTWNTFVHNATLRPEIIGPVAEGLRINFHVTGGEVAGPKLRGILRPVGGDWLTLRTDVLGSWMSGRRLKRMTRRLFILRIRASVILARMVTRHSHKTLFHRRRPSAYQPVFRPDIPITDGSIAFSNVGEVSFKDFEVHYDVYALPVAIAAVAV